jgi:cytochrome c oxidase assembly protein subunit 15
VENMVYYEATLFQPALIQFFHRMTAYTLLIIVLLYLYTAFTRVKSPLLKSTNVLLIIVLITQVVLGVATVVSSKGQVPVGLGVAHQFVAIGVVAIVVYLNYLLKPGRVLRPVDKMVEKTL